MEGKERDLSNWKGKKKDKSVWNGREMDKWNEIKRLGEWKGRREIWVSGRK